MSTKVAAPANRDYAQETRDNLQAQIDLSPKLLRAEQDTRPAYTALELATLDQTLTGTGGQRGIVDIYAELAPRLSAMEAEGASAQRAADIADIKRLGPEAQAALRAANPAQYALLDKLNAGALADLEAGSTMTPAMRREIEQYVRGGQAARGMGLGPVDLFTEAMTLGSAGEELLNRRRQFAAGLVGLNQSVTGDPFLQITGRPSGTVASTAGVAGQGTGIVDRLGPAIFNPESQYGADLAQGNYEGQLAARTASASSRAGLFGGLIKGVGSLAGGAIAKDWR